ncbi:non-hydrolyzing UDP-N-acetylglucosamine 2-epimerase [Magnetospirillum fulvum]|uniref:UDP-N-acetylglucosamine 2-epimerase n=1 Tax=Magnetospirillum fulvum MGU-K5 TaxID=1316936 RepID=S9SAL2_MAGFU|nr:UDP-N-acetylglucosamine 2-epimerase (non-hydrolyzing) [Magnetospirillum fulvum]EPY01734.1 UDP-N-acetylglucosamine 2-epimerase [Magnetospirillum fulvum MGU-K5]
MKILTIIGARPQFVKAAVVSRALVDLADVSEVLVHTGQHYDEVMSGRFFRELGIPAPAYNLGVGSGSHGAQTGRMLERLDTVIEAERPDWVLLYGDTNSTLAGALAAAKLHVPVAHVEAGLRSWNRAMPEEINRLLTDQVSSLLFAPTEAAVTNLTREGIAGASVHLVGDVMFDAALAFGGRADADALLTRLGVVAGGYVLLTIHRAENTDDPARLSAIVAALGQVARSEPVVLPCHPRTMAALERAGLLDEVRTNLICVEPMGYLEMLAAERLARVVVTDSGGVQKEAFFFGVPCVIVRGETEWVELVELGCARLVEPDAIAAAVSVPPAGIAARDGLYGGGAAAERVARIMAGTGP